MNSTLRPTRSKDLLIIDDDVDIGQLIARVGREAGLSTTVLSDPTEFKRAFDELRPSVVTIDILMPMIDGIELVTWLTKRRTTVRIIVVSGSDPLYAEIANLIAASNGAEEVHFLPKPLDVGRLREVLALP